MNDNNTRVNAHGIQNNIHNCVRKALSEDNQRIVTEDAQVLLDSIFSYGRNLVSNKPHFEVVSFEQFRDDMIAAFDEYDNSQQSIDEIQAVYNEIKLPVRSTKSSAGYDFRAPFHFYLKPGQSIMIPTGIRAYMPSDMVLMIYPRSGLGTKYQLIPCNLTAVVDADYYNADNEGHIHMRMINKGNKTVTIDQGQAFVQGVFTKYYTTADDSVDGVRRGGMGSTDKH